MKPALANIELAGLFDNLATAILLLDRDGRIAFVNASAQVLLESSATRLVGSHYTEVMLAEPGGLAGVENGLVSEQSFGQSNVSLGLASGGSITVDYTVSTPPPAAEVSEQLRYRIIEMHAKNHVRRISLEEEQQADHHAAQILVRGLAHEIKNPLGGIRGAAQLLGRALRPGAVNIHEVLQRIISLIEVECGRDIDIRRDYDVSIPEFQGDRGQLIQGVLNIARNAVEALTGHEHAYSEKARILFRTRTVRRFTLSSQLHKLVLRAEVIDNGRGVPPALMKSIFYPMISGRAEGTGLGLSITQGIIGQHGGIVECDSEPGRTSFIVYLPLEKSP